jgi:hypothetical protein
MCVTHDLGIQDGLFEPDFSDLMQDLVWTPGYGDPDVWFSPASAAAEGIVIHETSAWPVASEAFETAAPSVADLTSTTDAGGLRDAPFPLSVLEILLDANDGRAIRGYLAAGRSLPSAHVLCCALAVDADRRNQAYASFNGAILDKETKRLRTSGETFWRQVNSCGPFEFLVATGFVFETVLAEWLAHWGMRSCATWSHRRAELGREVLRFLLDQDPSNWPAVQSWLDRWTARCADLLGIAHDVFSRARLPGATVEMTERIWNPFSTLAASLADLAVYGITPPAAPGVGAHSRARA